MNTKNIEWRLVKTIGICYLLLTCFACNTNPPATQESIPPQLVNQPIEPMHSEDKKTVAPVTELDSTITTSHLMGKFDPLKDEHFVEIEIKYADRSGQFLHRETYASFINMHNAAKKEGIDLIIKSATRNFTAQKNIWEGKWNGKRLLEGNKNAAKVYPIEKERALKILEYSSMPGTSRHHWGTDIDLNAFVNSYFEKGKGKKEYDWLVKHAGDYGFCQPYTPKGVDRPDGYNEEKWHWSFLPLAKRLSDQYKLRLKNQDISGFDGAKTAVEINIVKKYVLGINQECL